MRRPAESTPSLVPVLSPGRHRNPRRGACFMEFASYLAGERWSDHPSCTHPLLSAVARRVNDTLPASTRSGIVELIPRVVGLAPTGEHVDLAIALRVGTTALPVSAESRQRVLAAGLLACLRRLDELGLPPGPAGAELRGLQVAAGRALADVPHARAWGERFIATVGVGAKRVRTDATPTIVRVAVEGVAEACVRRPDELLVDLLVGAIEVCERFTVPVPEVVPSTVG